MAKNEVVEATVDAEVVEATDDAGVLEVLSGGVSAIGAEIRSLAEGAPAMYSSVRGGDFATKKFILEKVTNSKPVADHLGTVIELEHVIVQAVVLTNRETGVASEQPRVILIDKEGTAYHATSRGLWMAVKNVIGILGEPSTWDEPVPVAVRRERAATGHFFTMDIAG